MIQKPLEMRPKHVNLIFQDKKIVTRRFIDLPSPLYDRCRREGDIWIFTGPNIDPASIKCRYGAPQDEEDIEYWVKERTQVLDIGLDQGEYFALICYLDHGIDLSKPITKSDFNALDKHRGNWREQSFRYMRKSFARLWLKGCRTWAEQLKEMTPVDAQEEGYTSLSEYQQVWDEINPDRRWNPRHWVWGLKFQRKS